MANAKVLSRFLKQSLFIFLAIGKTICEFKAVVGLYTFNFYAKTLELLGTFFRNSEEEYVLCSG